LLVGLVMGAAITAGCGVLLDLSHLDDGTSTSTSGSTGAGGVGGMASSSASVSTGAGGSSATVTSSVSSGNSSASSTASAGSGGSGGGSGGDAGAPPPGIEIVSPGPPALHFRIDATEVTVAQYAAFVKAFEAEPPANHKQHPVCGWNQSVKPNTPTMNDAGPTMAAAECNTFDLDVEAATKPTMPVRCIDWCDAAAYCLWAGGYMCRSNEGDMTHPIEWKTACGTPAGLKYPYGPTYLANHCNDSSVLTKPVAVATNPGCEGGYSGVFDMSGNVSEWLDCGCEYEGTDPTTTNAYIGGGAYHNTGDDLDCTPNNTSPIGGFRKDVGVRCCYDP
jgi:hypothetical protein